MHAETRAKTHRQGTANLACCPARGCVSALGANEYEHEYRSKSKSNKDHKHQVYIYDTGPGPGTRMGIPHLQSSKLLDQQPSTIPRASFNLSNLLLTKYFLD